VRRRRRARRLLVAVALAMLGLAIVGVLVWRTLRRAAEVPPPQSLTAPTPMDEDFSVAERRGLEDILKRKGAGAQQ